MTDAPDAPDLIATLRSLMSAGRFQDALATWRGAPGADARRGEALLLAGTASMRMGDVVHAGALAADAVDAFRSRGDQDGQMRALNLQGAVAFEVGALDEATARFALARSLAVVVGDTLFQAHAVNNLASVAHLRGDAEDALSLYREALLSYQRLGDRRGIAQTYHNLGLAFRELGIWQDADDATHQAQRHAILVEDAALAALAVTGRAELDIARGAFEVAAKGLDRAGELANDAGDVLGVAEVGRVRATLALDRDDPERALAEAASAGAMAREQGSALLVAECAAVEALALRRLRRTDEAEARRTVTLERFARLGAAGHADRFNREWEAA